MSTTIKSKVEAILYAAENPVTVDQIADLLAETVAGELELAPGSPELKVAAKEKVREAIAALTADYSTDERAMEVRNIAGGYRIATKPEHHDVVRGFAKSLKPPIRLSMAALETLAVIAYKQPVTVPEISEIRGVDSGGVIGTLLERKLITTGGRKEVIGRPILYKTTKDFLLRFGLKDLGELPSIEEFEKLITDSQSGLFGEVGGAVADATGVPDLPEEVAEQGVASPANAAGAEAPEEVAPETDSVDADEESEAAHEQDAMPQAAASGESEAPEPRVTHHVEPDPEAAPGSEIVMEEPVIGGSAEDSPPYPADAAGSEDSEDAPADRAAQPHHPAPHDEPEGGN